MHAARRVVRTESNYCTNQAELKGMKDAGFDEYEFISLGENAENVCRVCDELDGQRFKIADAVVGVNCPPMHPFCRCKVTTPRGIGCSEEVFQSAARSGTKQKLRESEEDIQRETDERIDSWNIPEGMSLDEFVERVNNGELEEIRKEQGEKAGRSDVTDEYLEKATPGIGALSHDSECTKDEVALEKYQDELDFAERIHNSLGGDIHVNAENDKIDGVKFPDYLWRGKLWDLKSPSNEEAANGLVRKGMKQILKNPGGIILNFCERDVSLTLLEKVLDERMKWYKDRSADIIVFSKNELIKVYRYKK